MADPRLTGTHRVGAEPQRNLTFRIDASTITYGGATVPNGSAVIGRAVGLVNASAGVVELVADGQKVLGKLLNVEADGACTVECEGVVLLPGGDAPPATGSAIVGATLAAARGYVRAAAASGATYAEGASDDALAARGLVLDGTVTTAVEVLLGW